MGEKDNDNVKLVGSCFSSRKCEQSANLTVFFQPWELKLSVRPPPSIGLKIVNGHFPHLNSRGKWAKAQGLYSNLLMGYWGVGKINSAIALCFQLYPNASPASFRTIQNWGNVIRIKHI
jgi:hypothetical protein